ncbi:MAG: hypothetical protein VB015_01365 [Erysipelotrichaceae bacterium]|nr:hypothetical protein [Erysipelotrichaceae bacterium]
MIVLDEISTLKIVFIIIVPIIFLLVIAFILYKPIRKSIYRKKYRELYGKRVYKIALYEDFYLINLFNFKYDDKHYAIVDHVLFSNKYIYVIMDKFYDGSIAGKIDDQSLVMVTSKGKKQYIDNPIIESKAIVKRIALMTNIDPTLFIGISLTNEECAIDVQQTSKDFYIIQVNKLTSLVNAIESRNIEPINPDQLQRLVNDMDRINKKRKKMDGYNKRN